MTTEEYIKILTIIKSESTTFLGLDASIVIAAVSVLIAVLALGLTIWQATKTIKHNKLSVQPHLSFHTEATKQEQIIVTMTNTGLGPAILDKMKVYVDDKEITKPKKIETAIKKVFPSEQGYKYTYEVFSLIDDDKESMSKDSNIELFSINFNKRVNKHIKQQIIRISIEIEYESFYGDKYKKSSRHIKEWP
jgi:hypothetical protein